MPRAAINNILSKIQKRNWFFGVRAEESLFFYSAKYIRIKKIMEEEGWPNFIETMLVPVGQDYPIRVFDFNDAKLFHKHSLAMAIENPELINNYINEDEAFWQKMLKPGSIDLKNLLELYARHAALFLIIFSLGKVMAENEKLFKQDIDSLLTQHNKWRNEIAFKEEKLGNIFFKHFNEIKSDLGIAASGREMMDYLSADEVEAILKKKIKSQEIDETISKRNKQGYIYVCLESMSEVIDDPDIIKKIGVFFKKLDDAETKDLPKDEILGQAAYVSDSPVRAKVIIIRDKKDLSKKTKNIKGKILVAIQTTPHYVPYLNDVKAIITDEGGITCHAAIISRELKIPCIVGTKIATQVLKDGDEVEVDATRAIVKVIKKA
jgi:phosphohistidine swiveling domain-containing protein